jgi:hypothetical protein
MNKRLLREYVRYLAMRNRKTIQRRRRLLSETDELLRGSRDPIGDEVCRQFERDLGRIRPKKAKDLSQMG